MLSCHLLWLIETVQTTTNRFLYTVALNFLDLDQTKTLPVTPCSCKHPVMTSSLKRYLKGRKKVLHPPTQHQLECAYFTHELYESYVAHFEVQNVMQSWYACSQKVVLKHSHDVFKIKREPKRLNLVTKKLKWCSIFSKTSLWLLIWKWLGSQCSITQLEAEQMPIHDYFTSDEKLSPEKPKGRKERSTDSTEGEESEDRRVWGWGLTKLKRGGGRW